MLVRLLPGGKNPDCVDRDVQGRALIWQGKLQQNDTEKACIGMYWPC